MTDFTKTKISFALALLGTLFILHPIVQRFEEHGFGYMGYPLKIFYAYAALAGLLALSVYCYALVLSSERPHCWAERMGNFSYALALMVLPLYGGLYSANVLAQQVGQSHLAWAAPMVALSLGVAWILLSQVVAWWLRGRLAKQDQAAKLKQLEEREIAALNRAKELFLNGHYDLSVIEAWKAMEARLRRVLLMHAIPLCEGNPQALIDRAVRAGILREPALGLIEELWCQWHVAVGVEPLTKEAAESALRAARNALATIPVEACTLPKRAA